MSESFEKNSITHIRLMDGRIEVTEEEGCTPGKPFTFSDDHKQKIWEVLHKFKYAPLEGLEEIFFLQLEHHCTRFFWLQNAEKRRREDHRNLLTKAIKDIKATLQSLSNIRRDYVPLKNLREFDQYMSNHFADAAAQARILNDAKAAQDHLESLLQEIKKYVEPIQLKGKNNVTTVFFTQIAELLTLALGDIRLTKYKDGFFFELCETLLSIVDLSGNSDRGRDLSRSCSKAIDAINKASE